MQCLTSLQVHKFLSSQVLKFTSSKYITDITTSSQVFKFFYDGGWSNGGGANGGGPNGGANGCCPGNVGDIPDDNSGVFDAADWFCKTKYILH